MKCPYQTKVIHQPEYTDGNIQYFATDITKFCECLESECPFYYVEHYATGKTKERCRKAESEVSK